MRSRESTERTPHHAGGSHIAAHGRAGAAYGLAACVWWGFAPIYFKAVALVPSVEVLAHRIIWSVVLLAVWVRISGRWQVAVDALKNRSTLVTLLGTTALIAGNWLVFIWAVANNRVLQVSLGYFINPLFNVLLGFVFLRERLRGLQIVGVLLATVGVTYLAVGYGEVSWVALALPVSFSLYALLRKTVRADALVGLTVETALLAPIALAYLFYKATQGECVFGSQSRWLDLLLSLAGVITALPLIWYTNAARRLRLATLGFLTYIAPSLHFLLAVAVYREKFTVDHLITFSFIWTALIIYSVDTTRRSSP